MHTQNQIKKNKKNMTNLSVIDNNAQNVLYFFLFMLYKVFPCKLFVLCALAQYLSRVCSTCNLIKKKEIKKEQQTHSYLNLIDDIV